MGYQVLYVEDSSTMQRVMHIALAQENCTLHTASRAEEALALATQHAPAAVLIDTSLPNTNPTQLCAQLRALPACAHTHIFFVGGPQSPLNASSALQAGAHGFVQKPFTTHTLLETLHAALPASQESSLLHFPSPPSFEPITVPTPAPHTPTWAHTPSTTLLTQEDLASLAPPDFDITEWVLEASLTHPDMPQGLPQQELRHIAREVIERVAWEVVPALTEQYLRQHGQTLVQHALRTKRP
jgi:CheY-like chemotaxis protein